MVVNEGYLGRAVRQIVGIQLGALGLSGAVAGTLGKIFVVIGVLLVVSGTLGWCPVYHWLNLSTAKPGPTTLPSGGPS